MKGDESVPPCHTRKSLNSTHLDIFPHSDNIHSEVGSPIPLPGGKVWLRDVEPHFLMLEEWGFFME